MALVVMCASTGCYLEAGVSFFPRANQKAAAITNGAGTELSPATDESGTAVGLVLKAGLYFDLPFGYECFWGCAPVSIGIAQGGASVALNNSEAKMKSAGGSGTEVRADVDLGKHVGKYKVRATGIVTSIGEASTTYRDPVRVTEKGKANGDGLALFGGLTIARRENYGGLTVGLAHMSWDSEEDSLSSGLLPATEVSATGIQVRFHVALPSTVLFKIFGIAGTTEKPMTYTKCPKGKVKVCWDTPSGRRCEMRKPNCA
jgi:hypothetical protein